MTRQRYQQLLSSLLDEDLWQEDAEELATGLREHPEYLRDLRQQLILWDAWSQRVSEERSAEAFVAAWKTRLRAEAGSDQFARSVLEQIGAARAAVRYRLPFWKRWRPLHVGFALLALTFFAAAGWWAQQQFVKSRTLSPAEQTLPQPGTGEVVSITGEGVCIWCVLHEARHPGPALRVRQGGKTTIVYLEYKGYSQAIHYWFASGTTLTAKGILRKEGGHLILDTQSLKADGRDLH